LHQMGIGLPKFFPNVYKTYYLKVVGIEHLKKREDMNASLFIIIVSILLEIQNTIGCISPAYHVALQTHLIR
jgi:hypothetical protein